MIFTIDATTEVNTDDLTSEERHVVQKYLCYKLTAQSIEEWQQKKSQALRVGWNNSGPVAEGKRLKLVGDLVEKEIKDRLQTDTSA